MSPLTVHPAKQLSKNVDLKNTDNPIEQPYFVYAVNRTADITITIALKTLLNDNDDEWQQVPIQPIPPNCRDQCDACIDNEQYQLVTGFVCNEPPHMLLLAGVTSEGEPIGGYFDIFPSCDSEGIVLCLET